MPKNEPQPSAPTRTPPAPSHLNAHGKKEWRRIVKLLLNTKVYTDADHALLEAYCQAYGRWVDAEQQVQQFGSVIRTSNNNLVLSPYLSIANRALDQMQKLATEFGMSPVSRTRVSKIEDDNEDPFEAEFGGSRSTG